MKFKVLTGINDGKEVYQLMVDDQIKGDYRIGDFHNVESLGSHLGKRMFLLGVGADLGFQVMRNRMYDDGLGKVVETNEALEPYQITNLYYSILSKITKLVEENTPQIKFSLDQIYNPVMN